MLQTQSSIWWIIRRKYRRVKCVFYVSLGGGGGGAGCWQCVDAKCIRTHSKYANRNIQFGIYSRGHTALHKAVQQKHRNICYMLVAAGASLTMRDANGMTPMMIAFHVEDNDLATYLESKFGCRFCLF